MSHINFSHTLVPNTPENVQHVQDMFGDVEAAFAAAAPFIALSDPDGSPVRRGKSIIATEETVTSATFAFMPTADRVQNVVMPTDGLMFVAYQALWKPPVSVVGQAAIFLGANQLKEVTPESAPAGQFAQSTNDATPNYQLLQTLGIGLTSIPSTTTDTTLGVTTGMVLGTDLSTPSTNAAIIYAAAGTYDVGIKFKSASGAVSAKERKLWVWCHAF